jgi:thymidylate kinase
MRHDPTHASAPGEARSPAPRAPESATSFALRLINETVATPVLITGSLPPHGRDVDLLIREAEENAIESKLRENGFFRCRSHWMLFRNGSGCALELGRAESWHLPETELRALFAEARPVGELMNVLEPSPHHTLLILARKLGRRRTFLQPKHRRRIEAAVTKDPEAWKVARDRARDWDVEAALAALEAPTEDARNLLRRLVRRPRRTSIVSLSGLDGAGKSMQAVLLGDVLAGLGVDAEVEWSPEHMIGLGFLTSPIRKVLGYGPYSTAKDQRNPDLRPSVYPSSLVHPWVALMALTFSLSLWRVVWRHLGSGRMVICDRYILDFAVFLEYRHGSGRDFRLQKWLLRTLSPGTTASYLLDVSPETAFARKSEQYTPAELRRQAELFRANASRFGVCRLDGERPAAALCDEIASDVWQKLQRCAAVSSGGNAP